MIASGLIYRIAVHFVSREEYFSCDCPGEMIAIFSQFFVIFIIEIISGTPKIESLAAVQLSHGNS